MVDICLDLIQRERLVTHRPFLLLLAGRGVSSSRGAHAAAELLVEDFHGQVGSNRVIQFHAQLEDVTVLAE